MNSIRENALLDLVRQNANSPEMREFLARRFVPLLGSKNREAGLFHVGMSEDELRRVAKPPPVITV
jgi:hypothetical protein